MLIGQLDVHPLAICVMQGLTALALYLGCNYLMRSKIQRDAIAYFRGRL
ncbi:hypothetical protein [uncultured Duncaniella sp.]|nr:hypothetical protein [uncultured Duncaniella sp.]